MDRLFAVWVVLCLLSTSARATERPNIVVILADDLGYADIGSFGAKDFETPHLDRMAREGRRFTDFYVGGPACTPSRAALMTGCYPVRAGFADEVAYRADGTFSQSRVLWPNSKWGINSDEVTVPEVLRGAGYTTGMVGKWHLGDAPKFNPVHHGFIGILRRSVQPRHETLLLPARRNEVAGNTGFGPPRSPVHGGGKEIYSQSLGELG